MPLRIPWAFIRTDPENRQTYEIMTGRCGVADRRTLNFRKWRMRGKAPKPLGIQTGKKQLDDMFVRFTALADKGATLC